jgi:hypothetical protein
LHEIRHTSEDPHTVSPSLAAVARAAGFRSVEVVRLVVTERTAAAAVTGVLHRYPRTVPISLTTATRLLAAGAPVQIEHPGRDL